MEVRGGKGARAHKHLVFGQFLSACPFSVTLIFIFILCFGPSFFRDFIECWIRGAAVTLLPLI